MVTPHAPGELAGSPSIHTIGSSNPTGGSLSAHVDPSVASLPERTLESRELLAGGREVRIRHGADFYRLRVTQNGKLILQK